MELCCSNGLVNNPMPTVLPVLISRHSGPKEEERTTISPLRTTYSDYDSKPTESTEDSKYTSSSPTKSDQEQASYGHCLEKIQDKTYIPTILPNYLNINELTSFASSTPKINNSLNLKIEHNQTLIIFNEKILSRPLCKVDNGIILDASGGSTEYLI